MTKKTMETPAAVILVVDDEEPIRNMARRILESDGYRVLEASNGADAITLLHDDTPLDLLMADLEMPELMGDEMARRLLAVRPDLKVLFVTGHVDRLFSEQPLLWEGEAFLEKPFTSTGLLEAVALLLYGTLTRPTGS